MVSSEPTPEFLPSPELELATKIESIVRQRAVVVNAEQTMEYGNYHAPPEYDVRFTSYYRGTSDLPSVSHYEIVAVLTDGYALSVSVNYSGHVCVDRLPYDPESKTHENLPAFMDVLQTAGLVPDEETSAALERLAEQGREIREGRAFGVLFEDEPTD